jgi:pimeloyl-ACP methyl ester carboxylesterase
MDGHYQNLCVILPDVCHTRGMSFIDTIWHGWLKRPYILSKQIDQGQGTTVILLHGISRDSSIWWHVAKQLEGLPFRVLAFDLLGFGASPKPDLDYTSDDHAQAVLASLRKAHVTGKVILVGHSMGCLVAVRMARLKPELAKHLVLYEMPLYDGLPDKRRYRMRLNFYFGLYKRMIEYKPEFDLKKAKLAERLAVKVGGMHVTRETWTPFVKSLENTIMKQTAADDIKQIKVPMDVIFGTKDRLVIRGKTEKLFGTDSEHIVTTTIKERHFVSVAASTLIAERIKAA